MKWGGKHGLGGDHEIGDVRAIQVPFAEGHSAHLDAHQAEGLATSRPNGPQIPRQPQRGGCHVDESVQADRR